MATVTGYTSAKMQEIVDGTVESGYINGSGHLILVLHDATEIDAGSALPALPTASTTVAGIVELATDAEAITGSDTTRAVTPANLTAKVASATASGIVELATSAETITGTDTVRAVTPAGFAAGFDSRFGTKGLDDLTDTIITTAAIGHILQHNGTNWVNKSTIDQVVAATSTDAHTIKVTGETIPRLVLNGDGKIEWSDGTTSDVNLYRFASNKLKTDDTFVAAQIDGVRMDFNPASAGDNTIVITVAAEANARLYIDSTGLLSWGAGGASSPDTELFRSAASVLATNDDFLINTAGKGFKIKEGSNARMGNSTLVGGTVTVNNTSVGANTRIFLTCNTPGGTPGFLRVSARVNGTSFTILSSSGTDTSVVSWLLVEAT